MFLRISRSCACGIAIAAAYALPVSAQVSTPANPQVGSPSTPPAITPSGPAAPRADLPNLVPRTGPLPTNLTLEQAIDEAEARSPAITAAQDGVAASRVRLLQAGFRPNPELSVEVEN